MTTPTAHSRGPEGSPTPLTDEQIDALVAEKLMHWKRSTHRGEFVWDAPLEECHGYVFDRETWQPTRNIAQAFQVLEKFRYAAGKGVILCDSTYGWTCDISDGGNFHRAEANTASRAICLAALKAVGVQA